MAMMRLRREDPRVVGSFRLHRRLGAGGMGVVYLGSDKKGQRVALKVIRPDLAEDQEFRSRFAREVSAARRIRGGCTARLVAADLEAERPWFATQYVPGPSLHDKVADEGALGAAEVAAVGAALSEGLVAVHEAGVVHRDLKPSNILLSPKGPRIIDFGIAWATGASTLTHVGTAVGSPGFLAPEQVRGAAVTPATDVFSPRRHARVRVDGGLSLRARQLRGDAVSRRARGGAAARRTGRPGPAGAGLPGEGPGGPSQHPSAVAASEGDRGPGGAGFRGRTPAGPAVPGVGPAHRAARRHLLRPAACRAARARRSPAPRLRHAAGHGHPARPRPRPRHGSAEGHRRPAGRSAAVPLRYPADARPPHHTPLGGRQPAHRAGRRQPARATRRQRTSGPPEHGTGRRPANPQLLRQRLFVFVVVTVLVALGIAAAQGCQGPDRGLGGTGDGEVVRPQQEQMEPDFKPLDGDEMSQRYESTVEIPE